MPKTVLFLLWQLRKRVCYQVADISFLVNWKNNKGTQLYHLRSWRGLNIVFNCFQICRLPPLATVLHSSLFFYNDYNVQIKTLKEHHHSEEISKIGSLLRFLVFWVFYFQQVLGCDLVNSHWYSLQIKYVQPQNILIKCW